MIRDFKGILPLKFDDCLKGGHFMKVLSLLLALCLFFSWTTLLAEDDALTDITDIYPYRVNSYDKNDMQIINNGMAAFYARIDLIRRAEKSIDLEYFIFNHDSAGRIILKELAQAARRGVRVRVLVDKSKAVLELDEYYARVLKNHNIELRYYNAASILRLSSVQFRNHRKLIIRDGVEAITGGRNIADEYFNLSSTFNFFDRDIWISGELTQAMQDSFNLYWESKIVQIPHLEEEPQLDNSQDNQYVAQVQFESKLKTYNQKTSEAESIFGESLSDEHALAFALNYGKEKLNETKKYRCPQAAFATDREGASFWERIKSHHYHENYRLLRKEIAKWMAKAEHEVILDSPYFLEDKNSRTVMNDLLDRKIKITILTNSLASTDAVYVSTVFNNVVANYTPNPLFNAYIMKGEFTNDSLLFNDSIRKADWGTHAKTIVYNDDSFMVGTFNIDNRSNFYNTEMALFCSGSTELTQDILKNIEIKKEYSHHLGADGKPDDGSKLLEGATLKKKVLYYLLKIPASIMQFLM